MKFAGEVGFLLGYDESKPGVYKPKYEERHYTGDVIINNRRYVSAEKQNDDVTLVARVSIFSDLYTRQNYDAIRYVVWNGKKWKVTSFELLNYPRVVLEIGGVFNG